MVCSILNSFLESVLFKMSSVHGQVTSELIRAGKSLRTVGPCADMWLLPGVGPHVGFEMIRSWKLSLAHFALEWTNTRVFAAVSSQLVRSRESLSAALVIAHIRFLPCVFPNVHLKMRQLEVTLGTARVEANEWLSLLLRFLLHALLLHCHLWYNESGMRGHGHLYGSGSLVELSISWEASFSGSQEFDRKSQGHLVAAVHLLSTVWEDGTGRGRIVLQRESGGRWEGHFGSTGWCREVRILSMHMWLVSSKHHGDLGCSLRLDTVHWRVVGGELVLGNGRARIHRVVCRGRLLLELHGRSMHSQKVWAIIHIRRHCTRGKCACTVVNLVMQQHSVNIFSTKLLATTVSRLSATSLGG